MSELSVLYYQLMTQLPLVLGGGVFALGISFISSCYLAMACYCYVFECEWGKLSNEMQTILIKVRKLFGRSNDSS